MYYYETHLHTYPVSKCASVGVAETSIIDERDFAARILKNEMAIFTLERDEETWTFNLY